MREDGWSELNDKYGHKWNKSYSYIDDAPYSNQHKYDRYIKGLHQFGEIYDTRENGLYYEQSPFARFYVAARKCFKAGSFAPLEYTKFHFD